MFICMYICVHACVWGRFYVFRLILLPQLPKCWISGLCLNFFFNSSSVSLISLIKVCLLSIWGCFESHEKWLWKTACVCQGLHVRLAHSVSFPLNAGTRGIPYRNAISGVRAGGLWRSHHWSKLGEGCVSFSLWKLEGICLPRAVIPRFAGEQQFPTVMAWEFYP